MRNYPTDHKDIVTQLLDGRFIIYPSPLFATIQQQDEEYIEFFRESHGFELHIDSEFAYLSSSDSNERRTRDFTLFLAILCRELDYSGRNFRDAIELSTFDISETEQILRLSSKWEILEKTSVNEFETFINVWHKKNVLKRTGNQFRFTKAIKLFFEFAVNVANAKLREQQSQ